MSSDKEITISETKLTIDQFFSQLYNKEYKYPSAIQHPAKEEPMGNSESGTACNVNPIDCRPCGGHECCITPHPISAAAAPAFTPLSCWNPSPWHNTSPLANAFTCFKTVHLWSASSAKETTPRELIQFTEESKPLNCDGAKKHKGNAAEGGDSNLLGHFMPRFSMMPILSTFLSDKSAKLECKIEETIDNPVCSVNLTCRNLMNATPNPIALARPINDEQSESGLTGTNKLNLQNCCWNCCYPNCYSSCCSSSCGPCYPSSCCSSSCTPYCQKMPCWNMTPYCYGSLCNTCRCYY